MPFFFEDPGSEPLLPCIDQLKSASGRREFDRAFGVVTWGTTVAFEEVEDVFDIVEGGAARGG